MIEGMPTLPWQVQSLCHLQGAMQAFLGHREVLLGCIEPSLRSQRDCQALTCSRLLVLAHCAFTDCHRALKLSGCHHQFCERCQHLWIRERLTPSHFLLVVTQCACPVLLCQVDGMHFCIS